MLDSHLHSGPLRSKQILSAGLAGLIALSSLLPATAQDTKKDTKKGSDGKSMKEVFDLLEVLPEGSILRRVNLPKYNEDFQPVALLTAETMTVLEDSRIDGTDVTVNFYNEDGSIKARSRMQHAIYSKNDSILQANNAVFLEGQNPEGRTFRANGTGLVFDQEKLQGFLIGPVKTYFEIPPSKKSESTSMKTKHIPKAIAGSLIAITSLNTSAMAEPPERLTTAQIEELDQLAQPDTQQVNELRETVQSSQEKNDALSKKADNSITPFLTKINQEHLLVNTEGKPQTPEPIVEKEPELEPLQEEKKPQDDEEEVQILKVTCDGGLYFDNEANILAYLKNVHLILENQYSLTCSNGVKVFLDKKEEKSEKPKKEAPKEDKKKEEDSDDLLSKFDSFGELSRIIATGNVEFKGRGKDGKLVIATAEKASYDAKSEEMILSGGRPRIQEGANQYLQAQEPDQYIRIFKSGKFITSNGKWDLEAAIPKKKK